MDSMDNGHEMRIGFLYRLQQELSRYRHQLQTDQRLQHCSTAAHDATAAVMVPTVATCSAAALIHSSHLVHNMSCGAMINVKL